MPGVFKAPLIDESDNEVNRVYGNTVMRITVLLIEVFPDQMQDIVLEGHTTPGDGNLNFPVEVLWRFDRHLDYFLSGVVDRLHYFLGFADVFRGGIDGHLIAEQTAFESGGSFFGHSY